MEHALHASLFVGTASFSVHEIVNDGLMTLFFTVAGLEIKRELVVGELRTMRQALLPLVAAAGGMIVPAVIYLVAAPAHRSGWAIPTATDIAFAIGVLAIVKKRVPRSLVVFLTALAIFDDLGAILVIALAYGTETHFVWLAGAALVAGALFWLARRHEQRLAPYLVLGVLLWGCLFESGVHPTLAGVAVGLAMPATGEHPPLERLLHALERQVNWMILPLFAFVNAGLSMHGGAIDRSVAWGVGLALIVGKTIGVFVAVAVVVKVRLAPMPSDARWMQILGVAMLAGIGFTMSLFVTELAFPDHPEIGMSAKAGVLAGSVVSAIAGLLVLRLSPTSS